MGERFGLADGKRLDITQHLQHQARSAAKVLLNHPVTFIKQVASKVFNVLLNVADLVG